MHSSSTALPNNPAVRHQRHHTIPDYLFLFPANIVLTPPKITIALTKGDTFFSRWVSAPTDMPPVLKPSCSLRGIGTTSETMPRIRTAIPTQNRTFTRSPSEFGGYSVASRRAKLSRRRHPPLPQARRKRRAASRTKPLTKRAFAAVGESRLRPKPAIRTERSGVTNLPSRAGSLPAPLSAPLLAAV